MNYMLGLWQIFYYKPSLIRRRSFAFFGRCVKRKEVITKYKKWDTEYPTQKTRNLFGKM